MSCETVDQQVLRISVIIPTYQRRDLVVAGVEAFALQEYAEGFEVIVAVDGSTDGTAGALSELRTPFPLLVLEQSNKGPAAARNLGGFAARGQLLLFMDDDMDADPRLLAEHDRSHREGAGIVVGDIQAHPESPPGLLNTWVKEWLEHRSKRLSSPGAGLPVGDLVGGQVSVSRQAFHDVGGFDERLRRGQDVDFACRIRERGHLAVFNLAAITRQKYVVTPLQYLAQWKQSGRVDVISARKQPELARHLISKSMNRWVFRFLVTLPGVSKAIRKLATGLVQRGHQGPLTSRIFYLAQACSYCEGLKKSSGFPRLRPLRVLAYHAIADSSGMGAFEPYGVRPDDFKDHINMLRAAGYHFVSWREVVHYVRGSGGLPRRPVLLTFDDCYSSVLEHALPVLRENGVPAVAFAVTECVGKVNEWDRKIGVPALPLAGVDGLKQLSDGGVEIGAHSRTHRPLTRVSATDLPQEVAGSCADLEEMGLGYPRLFAYPYGESDDAVRQAVAGAGCLLAFTVNPGLAVPGTHPYRIPRIEILSSDRGSKFLWKVAVAGSIQKAVSGWILFTFIICRIRATEIAFAGARHLLPRSARTLLRQNAHSYFNVGRPRENVKA